MLKESTTFTGSHAMNRTRLSSCPNRAGFSIVELLVVIVVITAMLAIQLPSNAAARRTARRMQNSTQLRGIHQGLVTFANSNKNNFVGLNAKGQILEDNAINTGNSGTGDFVQARMWILLNQEFITPEYAISPSEVANIQAYDPGGAEVPAPVQWNKDAKHYSYAMLAIDTPGRLAEWKETLNSQAIVLSDRNTGTNATDRVRSIHTNNFGEWHGSVLWNDNHVGFENEQYYETKFGNGQLNRKVFDNLFDDKQEEQNQAGTNALMIIADNNIVHAGE